MKLKSEEIYHVYNRGNNRQHLFYEKENYRYFLSKVKKYISPHCDIIAYCLMPNHFHLLIHANKKTTIPLKRRNHKRLDLANPVVRMTRFSKGIQLLLSSYAKAINKRYTRSGSLFKQNTKSKKTSSEAFLNDYSLQCFIYIHQNPMTAGLVDSPEDWEFSSLREYMGLRMKGGICNLDLGRQLLRLDINEIDYVKRIELPTEVIKKIFK